MRLRVAAKRRGVAVLIALSFAAAPGVRAQERESEGQRSAAAPLPTARELTELVAPAESVAVGPHGVRLESFRGDTISGVFLVDSDLPSARHVAFGKDPQGHRYVWFSRRNPLRASIVAIYEVDGAGLPDLLYWRQIDHDGKVTRAREFKAPAALNVDFEYSAGTPCGKPQCEAGWRELPLERIAVAETFFQPLGVLFSAAARHGEAHLDRPVATLGLR